MTMDRRHLIDDDELITDVGSEDILEEQAHCSYESPYPSTEGDLPGVVVSYLPSGPSYASDSIQSTPELKVYRTRWYVLAVCTCLGFMQGGLTISWTVIAASVEAAFGWTDATLSLMQDWLYITFLLSIFPFGLMMEKIGLRTPLVVSAGLCFLGTLARCITTSTPAVTWLAHTGNILIGFAGPVAFAAGPVISALWFPPNERATATATMTISGFAGTAVCFIVGPLFVDEPVKTNHTSPSSLVVLASNFTNIDTIKQEILYLRYAESGICLLIFLAMLIHLPSKPPTPPSLSAAFDKLNFFDGIKGLFRRENLNFWLVGITYGMSTGVFAAWSGMLNVNLKPLGISEVMSGWLGFYGVAAGCVAAIIFGRVADMMSGNMKVMSLCLLVGCIVSTFAFLIIGEEYVTMSHTGLYVSCIIQGLCNNAPIPLFYEMAIESSYPVTETVTSSVMTILFNIFPIIFLVVFEIPNVGTRWMNWALFVSLLLCFPLLLCFKERYRRLEVDNSTSNSGSASASQARSDSESPQPCTSRHYSIQDER